MAKVRAAVTSSHVPAIGAAIDLGKSRDPYWAPLFQGYEFSKRWIKHNPADVVLLVYNNHATAFSNDGPLGTLFRYICDHDTYIARYDELVNGRDEKIDVSKVDVSINGIELQDREFIAAIRERREPNASVVQVLPCYRTLRELELQLHPGR
jgi:hypothetical protein